MTARSPRPAFQRIPAPDVEAFVASQGEFARMRSEALSVFEQIETDAQGIAADVARQIEELERRVEREAEEIAERSARKFAARQEAIVAATTLAQAAAIADDYARLEGWITRTILCAVERIVGAMPPEERWQGLIRRALGETRERWELSLTCHPDDCDTVLAAINGTELGTAITRVGRDGSLAPGVCHLRGNEDFFELDIACQVAALAEELAGVFPGQTGETC